MSETTKSVTPRREFLKTTTGIAATSALAGVAITRVHAGEDNAIRPALIGSGDQAHVDSAIVLEGCPVIEKALHIATGIYAKNYCRDMISQGNRSGHAYRMTVSPKGFPLCISMSPDLTFGLLGSRYLEDPRYGKALRAQMDFLPRNMRRNGKFFLNEDILAGAGRAMSQVMYLIWVWELYMATGDSQILKWHHEPVLRCLSYIDSRTDDRGLVNQVDHDDWQLSEGADWVDWCAERMEGSTCVYHAWYARALQHCEQFFQTAGDEPNARRARERFTRLRGLLASEFWSGSAYYANVNFNGIKVDNFWLDAQLWPIAFGFASAEQARAVFARIDADPETYEGVPTRWCAPVPKEKQYNLLYRESWPRLGEPSHRPNSWFGRLGAGDILARCATDQAAHAWRLLDRYCQIVVKYGTCPESLDMKGNACLGTDGQNDYLEHAGGLLLAVGRGLLGIDDTSAGTLVWKPQWPPAVTRAVFTYWHRGHPWKFIYEKGAYMVDPCGGSGMLRFVLPNQERELTVTGKCVVFP